MNKKLFRSTISTLVCVIIILLNTDLSCLKPSLKYISDKVIQKREFKITYIKPKYAVNLPSEAFLVVREATYSQMSFYVQQSIQQEKETVKTLPALMSATCRGSPLNRSP